jgi:hypothetical protein
MARVLFEFAALFLTMSASRRSLVRASIPTCSPPRTPQIPDFH